MDERSRAENEALKEMFQSEGWKVLMRNTQSRIEEFQTGFPFNVNNVEQLYFSKGMFSALKTLLSMEDQLSAAEAAEAEPDLIEDE